MPLKARAMDTSDPDLLPADLLPEGLEDRLPALRRPPRA
jgi:hypothetical protein